MQDWEQGWLDHRALWELELVGQPGVFGCLCALDALDWDHAGTVAWLAEIDRNEREGQ